MEQPQCGAICSSSVTVLWLVADHRLFETTRPHSRGERRKVEPTRELGGAQQQLRMWQSALAYVRHLFYFDLSIQEVGKLLRILLVAYHSIMPSMCIRAVLLRDSLVNATLFIYVKAMAEISSCCTEYMAGLQ